MSQELNNYYEVLGVAYGTPAQELKVAYRDLAKVWHPDRFAHDPRLQQKAQEKLKEINEAYEQLTSGKASFHKRAASTEQHTATPRKASRATWQLVVPSLCVFTVVLLIAGWLLIVRREPTQPSLAQEVESSELEQPPVERASEAVKEPLRAGKKLTAKQPATESGQEPIVERAAAKTVTPLPTETLLIDPTTGLLATAHCPVKSRMTYADGTAPRQSCSLHKSETRVASADERTKESRLKTISKRLASPTKWFGGKEKSGSAQRETPAAPNAGNQN